MHTKLRLLVFIAIFLWLTACKQEPRSVEKGEVVTVYTGCYQKTDEALFRSFEHATGIKVNIMYDSADELISRLEQQGAQPAADLLILKGICYLQQAKSDSLLQPITQSFDVTYPRQFQDSTRYWYALTYDPFVFSYMPDSTVTKPPATYAELIQKQWKGALLLPADQHFLHAFTVAMLADQGEEATGKWLTQVRENLAPKGRTKNVIKSLATDSAHIALVNASACFSSPFNAKVIFPDQATKGTYANITGVSLLQHAPHPGHATRLLSYLLDTETQSAYAHAHREYPARADARLPSSLQEAGKFRINPVSVSAISRYCDRTTLLLRESGF